MNTGKLTIYATCAAGWGKGKTLAEAIKNCINFSRGFINDGGKNAVSNAIDAIGVWMTDDPSPVFGKCGRVDIHKGYHYIYLGNEYNDAIVEHGDVD